MQNKKTAIKNLISCIIFLAIIVFVTVACTFLFRNTERAGRENIIGIKAEPKDSLDVVVIGGSSVYRFWDTMRAYNDYGFTSYDYSVSGMDPAAYIASIEDIKETQNPTLWVIEVRKLLSGYETTEIGRDTRNIYDSLDLNINRIKAINYFCKLHGVSFKDAISEYLDIIEYHDNYEALGEEKHWKYIDNRGEDFDSENAFKGFVVFARQNALGRPDPSWFTDEEKPLNEINDQILTDLLEYAKKNNLNILFAASPYNATEDNVHELNYIARRVSEYGMPFVNTNLNYDEMGLDFSTDFDDNSHVNNLGADKFTDFFGTYLKANYELPDHRGDLEYKYWDDLYTYYYADFKQSVINETLSIIFTNQAAED